MRLRGTVETRLPAASRDCRLGLVTVPFPEPTAPAPSRAEVFLRYLDFFRSRLVDKLEGLPPGELRKSQVPSGWTPIELIKHLTCTERRWLEWRFAGRDVGDPWADIRDDRWYVPPQETLGDLVAALRAQARRTRVLVESRDLDEIGAPGPGWDEPASLERVLFHMLQEYARHVGQLDVVSELAGGPVGE
jgi:uncharacterized damage-inducible protein DinB